MNIVIAGIGALGSLFAARLSGFASITMLGHWPEQVQALRQAGLTLIDPAGKRSQHRVQVVTGIEGCPKADLVLVLVKSYQTTSIAKMLVQILAPDGLALTLQNGLGNLEALTETIGAERAFAGTTSEGATLVEPGVVRHAGFGATYLAGRRLLNVATIFQQAGLETQVQGNIDGLLWGKLAISAGINPLTAMLRRPNGYLVDNDAARLLMMMAAAEVAAVAAAQEIVLPYPDAGAAALKVARATAANHSSMLQDVLNGRPTEIESITGEVIRVGRKYGVPAPANVFFRDMFAAADLGSE